MEISELLKPVEVDYEDRVDNLDVEASGVVKSKKYFPIYEIDGKEVIFKPLSKTKPLTTDMFSLAEVYWSYVINRYFDSNTPLYRLAICNNVPEKYYNNGTLVRRIGNSKFTNLLEYFNMNPEDNVNIKDYVNYCMMDYDYTKILDSQFIKSNKEIGSELAFQILLSILRMDQNFHYENINMDSKNSYRLIPPIDFEFSTPFLYPEDLTIRKYYIDKYLGNLVFPTELHYIIARQTNIGIDPVSILVKNIYYIVRYYPLVVDSFLEGLDSYYNDIDGILLSDDYGFVLECSSEYWKVGHARYKDNDIDEYNRLKGEIKKKEIDKDRVFRLIQEDCKRICERLKSIIKGMRILIDNGYGSLEDMTMDKLYFIMGMEEKEHKVNYDDILRKVLEYK